MRLRLFLALATGLAAGSAALASQPALVLPTPVVSLSSATLANRDSVAVVVAYTKRCAANGTCPTRWRVASVAGELSQAVVRTGLRDTLRVMKPICPGVLTVKSAVIADFVSAQGVQSSKTGAGSLVVPCRALTVIEKASLDSYPLANVRIVVPGNPRVEIAVGEKLGALCWIGRNRYTGKVIVMMADPLDRCEQARKAFEAERTG